MRKRAAETVSKFFEENEKEFDRIYDELVKVGTKWPRPLDFQFCGNGI